MNTQESNFKSYAKHKERVFTVRLDEEQRAFLTDKAKKTGLSKASLIRATLDGITIRPKNDKITQAVLKEMNAWGNNLNQLAKIANESSKAGLLNNESLANKLEELKSELVLLREKL